MDTHNTGLYLLNELLRDGHSQATLPLPEGKLQAIEDGATFTGIELAALEKAYSKSYGHSKPLPRCFEPEDSHCGA
jgi:hypothetical protein